MVLPGRIKLEKHGVEGSGPVVYWMSRDQRMEDNWALIYSLELSKQRDSYAIVIFCLTPDFSETINRTLKFMVDGLKVVFRNLINKNIPVYLLQGDPTTVIPPFIKQMNASILVTDFDPLLTKRQWKTSVGETLSAPIITVDSHNIVPCSIASPKQEFGAYTLRPKINKLLNDYLQDFPTIPLQKTTGSGRFPEPIWPTIPDSHENIPPINWIKPGEQAAAIHLQKFIANKLNGYAEKRNHPELNWLSNLSPYLHFGQISAQRVALEVIKSDTDPEDKGAFLEELIVRRELSDNYCFYNPNYNTFEGFPAWAKISHNLHRNDEREYIYTQETFEQALTHDKLWNAAQKELTRTGKTHGYLRMYWAKKILEWTTSPEEAQSIAIYLNDKYSLDGSDPNGYAGIAWSIGGLHDRAWFERSTFGKIRYMNSNGAKRKFDVEKYIANNESE